MVWISHPGVRPCASCLTTKFLLRSWIAAEDLGDRTASMSHELQALVSWKGDDRRHADLAVFLISMPTTT
jgi:hypothetical protein